MKNVPLLPRRSRPVWQCGNSPDDVIAVVIAMEHAWRDEQFLCERHCDNPRGRPQWDPRVKSTPATLELARQLLNEGLDPEHFVRQICRLRILMLDASVRIDLLPPLDQFHTGMIAEYRSVIRIKWHQRLRDLNFHIMELNRCGLVCETPPLLSPSKLAIWKQQSAMLYQDLKYCTSPVSIYLMTRTLLRTRLNEGLHRGLSEVAGTIHATAACNWRRYRDEFVDPDYGTVPGASGGDIATQLPIDFKLSAEELYRRNIGQWQRSGHEFSSR